MSSQCQTFKLLYCTEFWISIRLSWIFNSAFVLFTQVIWSQKKRVVTLWLEFFDKICGWIWLKKVKVLFFIYLCHIINILINLIVLYILIHYDQMIHLFYIFSIHLRENMSVLFCTNFHRMNCVDFYYINFYSFEKYLFIFKIYYTVEIL